MVEAIRAYFFYSRLFSPTFFYSRLLLIQYQATNSNVCLEDHKFETFLICPQDED